MLTTSEWLFEMISVIERVFTSLRKDLFAATNLLAFRLGHSLGRDNARVLNVCIGHRVGRLSMSRTVCYVERLMRTL